MENNKYQYRITSRTVIEAETPMAVGSGEGDLLTDALVAKDINGMPYIPGSSIAGVMRHSISEIIDVDDLFGFQEGKKGKGSKIIFSDGLMIGENGKALDGLCEIPHTNFYERYKNLPIRQHVRIGSKGVFEDKGKFDEQVVYKGTRFVFDLELISETSDKIINDFRHLLTLIQSGTVRFGGGTRKGFGKIKTIKCNWQEYDLSKPDDLDHYLRRSSRLDKDCEDSEKEFQYNKTSDEFVRYKLTLSPIDFFLFGSGLGDSDADINPVEEPVLTWENNKPIFKEGYLIPATSIKGALSHRTAYHWFKKKGLYADKENNSWTNDAVDILFGKAGDKDDNIIKIGNVMIDDIFINDVSGKFINHVAIDRFTGGSLNGALFTEKVLQGKEMRPIDIHITVKQAALADPNIMYAWEKSLSDLCNGLLPLGGGTNRGNGIFVGTYIKE